MMMNSIYIETSSLQDRLRLSDQSLRQLTEANSKCERSQCSSTAVVPTAQLQGNAHDVVYLQV